jgi:hypothetical protein
MSIGPDDYCEDFRAVAGLAEAFNATVELLTQQRTQTLTVEAIVDFAHRYVPRAQHSGLLLRTDGRVRTVAASSDLPQRLDELRDRVGEGPAFDVLETNDYVVSDDLAVDPRWPTMGPLAVEELNIRSVACYRLNLDSRRRAALMFLSDWPSAFDELAVATGAIFASYCSLVLVTSHLLDDQVSSRRAAEVHREIGVAAGILLASQDMPIDEAYQRLSRASRTLSRSMTDVARHVVIHGDLPAGE